MKAPKVDLAAKIAAHAEATRRPKGPLCRVCSLPAEWLEAVHEARDKFHSEYSGIARSMKVEGFAISYHNLQHHFQYHR